MGAAWTRWGVEKRLDQTGCGLAAANKWARQFELPAVGQGCCGCTDSAPCRERHLGTTKRSPKIPYSSTNGMIPCRRMPGESARHMASTQLLDVFVTYIYILYPWGSRWIWLWQSPAL